MATFVSRFRFPAFSRNVSIPTLELSHNNSQNNATETTPSLEKEKAILRIASRPTNWVEVSILMVASAILVFEGMNYAFQKPVASTFPVIQSETVSMNYEEDDRSVKSGSEATPATDTAATLPPRRILSIEH